MDKTTKNILLSALLLVMIICGYFTLHAMNNNCRVNNYPVFDQTTIKEKDNNTKKKEDKPTTKEDTVVDDETKEESTTKDQAARPNRPRNNPFNNNPFRNNNFNNNQFNNNFMMPEQNNTSNTIYYVLYGIECAIGGATILYLIILNTKKDNKKDNK